MAEDAPGQSVVQVLVPQFPDMVAEAGLVLVPVIKARPMLIKAFLPHLCQSSIASKFQYCPGLNKELGKMLPILKHIIF